MRRVGRRQIGPRDSRGGFTLIELPVVRKCKCPAFTLIELLVVIAIIALLMTILAPSLRHARELALSANCLGRTHSLSVGYSSWLANNRSMAMGYNRTNNTCWWDWSDELAPYVAGSDITFCPKVTEFTAGQLVVGNDCLMGGKDWAWRHKPPNATRTYEGSYGLNEWILNYDTDAWATWQDPQRKLYFETHMGIVEPSRTPILGDACWYGGWPKHTDVLPSNYDWPWSGSGNNMERWCVDRHNGAINVALADGSSKHVAISDLWGLKWNKAFDTDYQRPTYP